MNFYTWFLVSISHASETVPGNIRSRKNENQRNEEVSERFSRALGKAYRTFK